MTLEESRRAFDEQVAVRYDGLVFDRIKAMRVDKVDGRDIPSLELIRTDDLGKGRGEYIVRAKPEDVEILKNEKKGRST